MTLPYRFGETRAATLALITFGALSGWVRAISFLCQATKS
jgi:hypothetical protein